MLLGCSSCGTTKDVDAVCHHCGAPLCRDRRFCRSEFPDEAFAGRPRAVHCAACAERYHGRQVTEQEG